MYLPLPGERLVRIFGDMNEQIGVGENGEVDAEACLGILTRRTGRPVPRIERIGWSALFRIHSRMVDRYRVGRAFVAGDAAHLHSPVGAHGMNTSVQDAFNLGWKLAWVCKGWSPASLLDSYEEERRPIACRVLTETNLSTRMLMVRNGLMRACMGAMVRASMGGLSPMRQQLIAQALELDIDYKPNHWLREHHSSILQARLTDDPDSEMPCVGKHMDFNRGPAPGHHAPDMELPALGSRLWTQMARPKATLLLFDGDADTTQGNENLRDIASRALERWSDRLQVAIVSPRADWPAAPAPVWHDPELLLHRRYAALTEALYFLRPDGYVGFRSQPASAPHLFAYLQELWP
jgi:hypothetical protein